MSRNFAQEYLNHFGYSDWHTGSDGALRVGDYVTLFWESSDSYDYAQIVIHPNGVPVFLVGWCQAAGANIDEYRSIQGMEMEGCQFIRVEQHEHGDHP